MSPIEPTESTAMFRRSLEIGLQELRLLRRTPEPLVLFVLAPVPLMALFRPVFKLVLLQEGHVGVNGAEKAATVAAILFASPLSAYLALHILNEHAWNTWDRLRASASSVEIIIGKSLPWFVVGCCSSTLLFATGVVLFGLTVRGSPVALVVVSAAFTAYLVALGVVLVTLLRGTQQVSTFGFLGTVILTGTSGAMTPLSLLPGWVRSIAPANPSYWAARGFRTVLLDGGGVDAVIRPAVVLLAFAAGLALVAWAGIRRRETLRFA
jgi:ABC-2 type transport system permease protein